MIDNVLKDLQNEVCQKSESVMNLMPYALLAYNSSVHSFTKCKSTEVITVHFDYRDRFDVNVSSQLLQ